MTTHPREKRMKLRELVLAAITGLASGAARAAIGWLLGHITTHQ